MATIQVRELPEAAYEVLRLRARRAGQSIQLYMRDQLIALASRPTKDESLVAIESVLAHTPSTQPTATTVVDDLTAERR